MKYVFALLTITLFVVACQKEITGLGGDGTTTPGTPSKKCTGCSYLPVCDSAKLTYVDSTTAGVDTTTSTLAILGDTTINGKKFNRVSAFAAFKQGLLYNCDGGNYIVYQAVPNLGLNVDSLFQSLGLPASGVAIPSRILTTILKSNSALGSTWSDTVTQFTVAGLLKATVKIDYTLQEKGGQRTVLGKTYNNVIHVSSKLNLVVPLLPITLPFDVSVDTWYADSVGIVETRTVNNGVTQSVTKLLK